MGFKTLTYGKHKNQHISHQAHWALFFKLHYDLDSTLLTLRNWRRATVCDGPPLAPGL